MNNATNLAIAAILMAAILVVGATFSTTTTQLTAFAYSQKKKVGGIQDGSKNGNTVTIEECKNKGSASGFDTAVNQECQNLICTQPGDNATCVQEGITQSSSVSIPLPTTGPITTTLLVKKECQDDFELPVPCQFTIRVSGNNNPQPQPSTFVLGNGGSQLVTLSPGTYTISEDSQVGWRSFLFGDCNSSTRSGTISAGEHQTCTIRNILENG
jgi:hypothetical protein